MMPVTPSPAMERGAGKSKTKLASSKDCRHEAVAERDGAIKAASGFPRPMDRKLGSSELKPSFGLDEFRNDALWAEAVAEVSTRRSRLTAATSRKKS